MKAFIFLLLFLAYLCDSSYLWGMRKEVYERQKAFAGEKKPSMKRRLVGHDYTRPRIYMLTMVVEGRRALFGHVCGSSNDARMELSELGRAVRDEWYHIPNYHPEVRIFGLQMMPDHLHGILFISKPLACGLSGVVRGFKTGCGRAYRRLVEPVPVATRVATNPRGGPSQANTEREPSGTWIAF